jgi:hypothetical protein
MEGTYFLRCTTSSCTASSQEIFKLLTPLHGVHKVGGTGSTKLEDIVHEAALHSDISARDVNPMATKQLAQLEQQANLVETCHN